VLQVQVTYCALPRQHSDCLQQQLQQVADLVSQQQLQAAAQLMDDVIEWQLGDFAASSTSSSASSTGSSGTGTSISQLLQAACGAVGGASPASPYLVPACAYAVLLDTHDTATHAINRRTVSNTGSSPATDLAAPPAGGASISGAGSSGVSSTFVPDPASSSSPASPSSSSSSPGTPMDTAAGDEDLFDALDEGGGALGGSEGSSVPAVAAAAVRRGRSIVGDKDSPLQRLAKAQLQQLAQAAPPDELAPVAAAMQALLGRRHPVCAALQLLAEANMGPGARQARELRRQQRQLAQATALLQVRVVCLCVCVCVCV
jgi:hypothetical protein